MTIKNGSIFIQIASYRDPELRPTLKDLIAKADNPDRLHVCVCWQHAPLDEWDHIEEFKDDKRFTFIDVDYLDSQGTCWARNLIQQHYNGEDYTLHLDSHHRFAKGWDSECIRMIKQLQKKGHKKPLLTAYIPSYDPQNDPKARINEAWKLSFDRFSPEGVLFTIPETIDDWKERSEPMPSRFFSAHFCFTLGIFCKEVQHDPQYYFHGEEIALAVRAYTHGYDLFHPNKVVIWHEYTRDGKAKQWDDDPVWEEKNLRTFRRLRMLLGIDGTPCSPCAQKQLEPYTLGTERTLAEYEKYAGVRFEDRSVQTHTLQKLDLPCPEVEDYENSFHSFFRHCIDIHIDNITEDDYEFWVVAFLDENGEDLFRLDADKNEVQTLIEQGKNNKGWINLWRQYTGPVPAKWRVWPFSKSKEWCERLEGDINIAPV
tara:strand:- start:286 stop:1569 length:1284 start_codon:yes stop_codon:yes gene_type:complete